MSVPLHLVPAGGEPPEPPTPAVMRPMFSPTATALTLATNLLAIATAVTAMPTGPLADLLGPVWAPRVLDISTIIVALGSAHLSMSRSLLPRVDSTQS